MRSVEVDLHEILDIVAAAREYGYEDDVLFHAFGGWTGHVTDEEIQEYARALPPEYGEEDHRRVTVRLTEWRDQYAADQGDRS